MDKIKILYSIPNFDTAGSGKVLYDLAKGLNKEVFEVHIACSHGAGAFFKEVEALGLPIHFIEPTCALRPYSKLFKRIRPYRNFVKGHGFAIVHSWHWSSDWSEVVGARLGGAKFVFTKKAMSWGNVHWKLRSYLANFIITINHDMRAFFPWKQQQQLIPLGLDPDFYSPVLFPKTKEGASSFHIITVANLVAVKGVEVLIDAVLALGHPHVVLSILGDDRSGYALDLKEKVKQNSCEVHIEFLGKRPDVRPFLAQADLYVIPTLDRGEGMPMALVEAMSMGIPVLGSDVSGINYVLKDFPELLFEAGNVPALSLKLQEFMELPVQERQALGHQLRSYCMAHFSLEQFIKHHEVLYASMLAKKAL